MEKKKIIRVMGIIGILVISSVFAPTIHAKATNFYGFDGEKNHGPILVKEKITQNLDSKNMEVFKNLGNNTNCAIYYVYMTLYSILFVLTLGHPESSPLFFAGLFWGSVWSAFVIGALPGVPLKLIVFAVLFLPAFYASSVFFLDDYLHFMSASLVFYVTNESGEPIKNAKVYATPIGGTKKYTALESDVDGFYVISEYYQPPGKYEYKVEADGYKEYIGYTECIPATHPESTDPIRVVLKHE